MFGEENLVRMVFAGVERKAVVRGVVDFSSDFSCGVWLGGSGSAV
jgi:hypothetical protein